MRLPPRVHQRHGSYYYVVETQGKQKWTKLCRVKDGEAVLYKQLGRFLRPAGRTLGDLFDTFLAFGMGDLAPRTQKDYIHYIEHLRPVWADMSPLDVTSSDVAQYLENCKEKGKSVTGNRHMSCMSSVFNFAMRKGWCESNPCRGVRRNKEVNRTRYVRHDELARAYRAAPPAFQDFLGLAYLTGLRQGDLRRLRRSQCLPTGLRIEESKTGKVKLVQWSEGLRFYVLRAQSRAPHSDFILTNSRGEPWTEFAVQSAMRRLREVVGGEPWNLHDLRAKAESDHEEGLGLLPLYKRVQRVRPVR